MRSLFVLLLLAGTAAAHQTSVKYVDVTLDAAKATIAVKVAPGDVTEPLGLPADAKPTVAQATTPGVAAFVAHWIAAQSYGRACTAGAPAAKPDEEGKWVVVTWVVQCPRIATELDFHAFFAVDQRHVAIVHVEPSGRDAIARADSPVLALQGAPSLLAWVREGMNHIYTGRDHISFVLALLLVVMLVKSRDRQPAWHVRPPLATLRATATVITAFTIAHSVSLIAASLGWVHLPSRFVESAIAASIAYTAFENIVKPDVAWRFYLTFAFGLVHGLGFASTLSVLLPPRGVIVPLLCFNLGVELGQLTIVVIALPVFYVIARLLGAAAYRRTVMPVISVGIFVLGSVWLIERVFAVTIIGM